MIASEHDGNGDVRDNDVIVDMCRHLIVESSLGARLVRTAAKLYGRAKRRHGSSDHGSHHDGGDGGSGGYGTWQGLDGACSFVTSLKHALEVAILRLIAPKGSAVGEGPPP